MSAQASPHVSTGQAPRLSGLVCVVTGAARGIGRAVARRYAAEGATVYGLDRVADEVQAEMEALRRGSYAAEAVVCDLTEPDEVERAISRVLEAQGRVDVLANVAGVIVLKALEHTSLADWNRLMAVNLRAPFLTCRAVAPAMKEAGRGSVINVSSRAGTEGFADEAAYCASKWGLEGFSRAIALELGGYGVAVNTLTPGTLTHTAMSEQTYDEVARSQWRDPAVITPAFVHLALQTPQGLHGRCVNAWELSERLRAEWGEA